MGIPLIILKILAVWWDRRQKKRAKELEAWAQSQGLTFNSGKDITIAYHFPALGCLQQGNDQHYAYNVIQGIVNHRKIYAFDYLCQSRDHQNKRSQRTFSAVVVETDPILKPLFIRTENIFDKAKEELGFEDIKFESSAFNAQFFVKSPDRKWAYDVLNQKNIELLLSSCRFDIEFNGNGVIAYQKSGIFAAGYFPEAIQLLTGMLNNLPESLIQELKEAQ
jgi:hypothetical protein